MSMYHIYSTFDNMLSDRYLTTLKTWQLNTLIKVPIHEDQCETVSDGYKKLPYIKNVIDRGIDYINNDDNYVILFTNSDSCLLPKITECLQHVTDDNTQSYSRLDLPFKFIEPLSEEQLQDERFIIYAGKDGFAFTKNFWLKNRDVFVNMLFGAEFWDYIFYLQLKQLSNLTSHFRYIYHEFHYQKWCDSTYRTSMPSQIHNIKLAKEFLYKNIHLIDQPHLFELWEQDLFSKVN